MTPARGRSSSAGDRRLFFDCRCLFDRSKVVEPQLFCLCGAAVASGKRSASAGSFRLPRLAFSAGPRPVVSLELSSPELPRLPCTTSACLPPVSLVKQSLVSCSALLAASLLTLARTCRLADPQQRRLECIPRQCMELDIACTQHLTPGSSSNSASTAISRMPTRPPFSIRALSDFFRRVTRDDVLFRRSVIPPTGCDDSGTSFFVCTVM